MGQRSGRRQGAPGSRLRLPDPEICVRCGCQHSDGARCARTARRSKGAVMQSRTRRASLRAHSKNQPGSKLTRAYKSVLEDLERRRLLAAVAGDLDTSYGAGGINEDAAGFTAASVVHQASEN